MILLSDIEPEIVTLILEFVNDVSPRTTRAIACVNRYFSELTKIISHRHKTIELKGSLDDDTTKLIASWVADDLVLTNIRTLTIKGWFEEQSIEEDLADEDDVNQDDDDDEEIEEHVPIFRIRDETWAPLATLLAKIGRLKCFLWNIKYPLPPSVLEAFEKSQMFSTLRIFNFIRAAPYQQQPDDVELRLLRSSALTHIRYVEEAEYASRPDVRSFAFRGIVASAPNLEYAGFLNKNHTFRDGEAIAESKRYEPAFYKHKKPNASVKQLTLDGFDVSMDALTDWSSIVDLTALENVKFSRGVPTLDYFQSAATMLPNLKHLSLNLRSVKGFAAFDPSNVLVLAVQDYIRTCAPLQTLSLWSWIGIIPLSDILSRHGATLLSLQLHEREMADSTTRSVLSIDDVRSIGTSCTSLREFTFDLNRSDAKLRWEKDNNTLYYEELAKFNHLNSLQIYFDLGVPYILRSPMFSHADANNWSFDEHTDNEENPADGIEGTTTSNSDISTNTNTNPDPASTPLVGVFADIVTDPAPAAKRQRTMTDMRPSRDTYLGRYVKRIWATVFGSKTAGARHLDVKVGEWEGSINMYGGLRRNAEWKLRRHFQIRPHERDDVDEAVVKIQRRTTQDR